jgi:GDP-L-fucose synthase
VRPEYVFLAAGEGRRIWANQTGRLSSFRDNLFIEANVIDAAWRAGVRKLLYLGSSCVYPKFAEQPIREESLLGGALEPTNEPYAVCEDCRHRDGAVVSQAVRDERDQPHAHEPLRA